MTKGQLCKLIFKHEEMERQRIDMIQKQQGLISRQSGALIWQAEKIGLIAEQFPAIREKEGFKELLKMAADLVTQAEQFKAFEKEKTDGPRSKETAGKSRKRLPRAGKTEPLRDADPERESNTFPAQPSGEGQSDPGAAGR